MENALLDVVESMLVCPVCRQMLKVHAATAKDAWLLCAGCGRSYPVQDGIPVLIEVRARLEGPSS